MDRQGKRLGKVVRAVINQFLIRRCQSLHNREKSAPSHVECPRSTSSPLSTHDLKMSSKRKKYADLDWEVHPGSPDPVPPTGPSKKGKQTPKYYIPGVLNANPKLSVAGLFLHFPSRLSINAQVVALKGNKKNYLDYFHGPNPKTALLCLQPSLLT